jgi:hypothetical protein
MHTEFVVGGPPISNQSPGPTLIAWRARVAAAARVAWVSPPLATPVRVTIINFHAGSRPSLDVDNMSKPVLDVMNGLVYLDDRQVWQAELVHLALLTPLVVAGAPKPLVDAARAGVEFVYIRVERTLAPYPLPR